MKLSYPIYDDLAAGRGVKKVPHTRRAAFARLDIKSNCLSWHREAGQ